MQTSWVIGKVPQLMSITAGSWGTSLVVQSLRLRTLGSKDHACHADKKKVKKNLDMT